jgi:hypothetical protein
MPWQCEKYIPSKILSKRLKKALNLSLETASRSMKECAPRRKIAHLRIVVETFGQVAPLLRESVDCRLPLLFCLLANLDREVNQRRNSDANGRQLAERCQHFPVHFEGTITVRA